ncbi:acyl carrier protein [Mycolicibacterium cosmeticum]|jgi:acyl carrier protein|uniref:Acyl carrier protein n=1 Tax=Mycolicibacterium cosmeticum TaxID=258533 RepID=W9AV68_MYCCO|nr:acyl carrier protein [Mycolicibacterium cosmeticum]TLH74862.1 acyl carrier protein [Mycolicibacterium cosmeticum]CDO09423.1 acyl carrier protein [Mycolicibacterium cosmeticum]
MTNLQRDVLTLVAAMAPDTAGQPELHSALVTDLGYSSLRLLELAIAVERAFALPPLPQEALATVTTVADLVEVVRTQKDPS